MGRLLDGEFRMCQVQSRLIQGFFAWMVIVRVTHARFSGRS